MTVGFILYAAMAAHRAHDPAVMCRILGCHPLLMEWHVTQFDCSGAHLDAVNLAALRVFEHDSNTVESPTRTGQ